MVRGFDASMFQGEIDWPVVAKSEYEFAVVKVSDGIATATDPNPIDPQFARNWRGAKKAGLIRGAYVFSRPAPGRNPAAEVRTSLKAIEHAGGLRHQGDLPLVLDIEWSAGLSESELEEWVKGWIRVCKALTGKAPIIYTGAWWRDHGLDIKIKAKLWLAAYVANPDPYVPRPSWDRWTIWQNTSTGRVAGINGDVDLNVYRGSKRKLRKLATLQRNHKDHDEGTGGIPAPAPHPHHPPRPKGAPKTLPVRFYHQWAKPWEDYGQKFKDWLWDHGYVSPHFTRLEWACHCGEPVPSSLRHNCQRHGANLEKLRHALGDKPLTGISFYRPKWYNDQIGGASLSRHVQADASDFPKSLVDRHGHHTFFAACDRVFSNGGVGEYPGGSAHVDSRGTRARWTSW